jgi:cobalt/nickel transport system permease protein
LRLGVSEVKRQATSGLFFSPSRLFAMTLAVSLPPSRHTFLGRLDPRWKLVAVSLAGTASAFLRTLPALGVALALSMLLAALARLPLRWYLERMGALSLALAIFILPMPLLLSGDGPAWNCGWLRVSWYGARAGLLLAGKALTVVHLMLALLATTPPDALLKAGRSLGLPARLVHVGLLTFRYLFLLAEELHRLRIALRIRGFRNRANLHSYRLVGQLAGILLVRGAERAEHVSHAMRSRGFDGEFRSLARFQTCLLDVAGFLFVLLSVCGVVALDRLLA